MQPYPSQSRSRTAQRTVLLVCGLITLIGALVLLAPTLTFTSRNWDYIGQRYGPSCTIGFSGTSVTLTVQGWSASQDCDAMVSQDTHNPYDASVKAYHYQGTPQGRVLCQYTIGDDLFSWRGTTLGNAPICRR